MGKGGSGGVAYRYYMTLHVGVCTGFDEITRISLGDTPIWEGVLRESRVLNVEDMEAFGGDRKEGGYSGALTVCFGDDHQVLPQHFKDRFEGLETSYPDYRGVVTVMLHEKVLPGVDGMLLKDFAELTYEEAFGPDAPRRGFYFQANTPYLSRSLRVRGNRAPKGLDRRWSRIPRPDDPTRFDANPVGVIYEMCRDPAFSAEMNVRGFDTESWEIAQKAIYDEGYGVSFAWVRQESVKNMIVEVIGHIRAMIYPHPRTQLLKIRLLRGDYDVENLRVLDPSNCRVVNFERKQDNLTNDLVVTYTQPDTQEDATVNVQNIAAMASDGFVSDTRDYYMFRRADLAAEHGEGDLRQASYPLVTAEVEADRSFWDVEPGDVLVLRSPIDDENDVILRVLSTTDRARADGPVTFKVVEDIFSLDVADTISTPNTLFVDPDGDPIAPTDQFVWTLPYALAYRLGLNTATDEDYPATYGAVVASTPQMGAYGYDLVWTANDRTLVTNPFVARAALAEALVPEATSNVGWLAPRTVGEGPKVDALVLIGTGADDEQELALVTGSDTDGWLVQRGLADTVPRHWPAGTRVYVIDTETGFYDPRERSDAQTVTYKILPKTPAGTLPAEDATAISEALTDRQYAPLRPANVRVGGVAFGTLEMDERGDIAVAWARRNRLTEDSVFHAWDAADVTPETGQTTTIDVETPQGVLLARHSGITGTSFSVPEASADGRAHVVVRVYAQRDGYTSIQSHAVAVTMPPAGSGAGFGAAFGSSFGAA